MEHARQLVHAFLTAVQEGCGAEQASVFIPAWPGLDEAILVHSGAAPALPELQDADAALEFARANAAAGGPDAGSAAIHSRLRGGALLPIPLVASLWQSGVPARTATGDRTHARRAEDLAARDATAGWVALRFPIAGTETDPLPPGLAIGQPALRLASRLASLYLRLYGSLTDPLTGLPGRAALRTLLRQELAIARADRTPFSLIFLNPDDFAQVNHAHGRRAGDLVLREVVLRAEAALRRSDLLYRYGSAIFGVILANTGHEAAVVVADKLRTALGDAPFLDGKVSLAFSAGVASLSPGEAVPTDAGEFIGRVEGALAIAKRTSGGGTAVWRAGAAEPVEPCDRLRHAFTGDQSRDYRNMGLLWDAVGLLATTASPGDLARRVVSQLQRTLAASLVALFEPGERGLELKYGLGRADGNRHDEEVASSALTAEQRQVAARAAETRVPVWSGGEADDSRRSVTCALPLMVDEGLKGVLLLAGTVEHVTFDESDLLFMKGFAGPIALALDRARGAERLRQQAETEKRRLVGELKDLRTALRQARLVYVSRQMEDLIVTAHQVADTDATILITGESGTGKEMLAQTIHQMSSRRTRPLVIVDCGAIPSQLIESELFGHERGAFTGALTRSPGRLGQADGGTVLLDEIGELPLDVQSKLLRFVQEKQFMTVGSSVVRRVDVRVLAATNRDLAREVAAGRFRGDLYHRLNVIPFTIPPLRDRKEDIVELARHFLETFAAKYQKAARSLGADVEDALVRYDWPGNIRELQNRIMRAVIMSSGDTLSPDALDLPSDRAARVAVPQRLADPLPSAWPAARPGDAGVAWAELRAALTGVVAGLAATRAKVHPPLGRWLGNDLVLAALDASGGVARRAAGLLGVPETTFVRRLRRAQSELTSARRPSEWEPVGGALARLVLTPLGGVDALETAESCLLAIIEAHLQGNATAGASLLGTSLPTFRRRLESLQAAS